jgi:hypothetical protein
MKTSSKIFISVLLLMMLPACWLPAAAQGLRDPTLPPFGFGSGSSGARSMQSLRGIRAPLSVIAVDGRWHLVIATRLYAEGEKLGEARIERITETEVWLREGRELRKISNFVGVQRRSQP